MRENGGNLKIIGAKIGGGYSEINRGFIKTPSYIMKVHYPARPMGQSTKKEEKKKGRNGSNDITTELINGNETFHSKVELIFQSTLDRTVHGTT